MYVPAAIEASSHWWRGAFAGVLRNPLWKRQATSEVNTTIAELSSQWSNPSDVSTILLVIGGDVVQSALAQSTGTWFTPVCFSFGWVSYAFAALIHVVGDGRLLPAPDYPVKLFNLKSGYARDNKNWVVGRLLRDAEAWVERREPLNEGGIRISIFEAQKKSTGCQTTKFLFDRSHAFGFAVMLLQLIVASIPIILNRAWGVLFIAGAGTILAQIAGSLPQWTAEKLPNRQHSDAIYALTKGNGSKDIIVIIGRGQCLDLEELSVSDTPRSGRPWEKFERFSKPRVDDDDKPPPHRTGTQLRKSLHIWGLPSGFWVTRIVSVLQSILWLLLLVNVAAIKADTWYLLLVGGIGMFQNGILAAMERPPRTRNIPLRHTETIIAKKAMDGLMDFQYTYQYGRPLLREFFPGDLRPEEDEWWNGKPDAYDKVREAERRRRGVPRRFLPPIKTTSDPAIRKPSMVQAQESKDILKPEKDLGNPFSDLEASRDNPPKPQGVSWATQAQVLKPEETIPPPSSSRVVSPYRSSLRPSHLSTMSAPEEGPIPVIPMSTSTHDPQSTMSSLSAEEVVNSARSPDWAY